MVRGRWLPSTAVMPIRTLLPATLGMGMALVPTQLAPVLAQGFAAPYGEQQVMPGQTLLYPSPGVVCDQRAQLCYDGDGLSLGLTSQYFGAFAADNARRNLGGQRPSPVFQLSNGSRCNVRKATCWDAGFGQPMVNPQLTRQLFGAMPRPTPAPMPYPAPGPGPDPRPAGGGYTAQCLLQRSGSTLFNGPCALNEVRQGYQSRYEVMLQNGPRYLFEQRGDGFQIADSNGGHWPVQFTDNGSTGQFRWSDLSLRATQNNYRPEGPSNPNWGRALGSFLRDLFN